MARRLFYWFLALIHFHAIQILSIIFPLKLLLYLTICIIIFNRHSLDLFLFPIRIDISNPSPCSTIMLLLFDCMQPVQGMSTQPLRRELTVSTVREEPICQNTMNLLLSCMCVLLVSNYVGGFHFIDDQISPFAFIYVAHVNMHKWKHNRRNPPFGKGHCVSQRCNIFSIEFLRGQPHSPCCHPGLLQKCAWQLPWRVRRQKWWTISMLMRYGCGCH